MNTAQGGLSDTEMDLQRVRLSKCFGDLKGGSGSGLVSPGMHSRPMVLICGWEWQKDRKIVS